MLSTPFGRPASRQISHSRYAVIGVSSLGLATAVLPQAMRGRDFPAQQIERQIPRRNQSRDAARLTQGVVERDAVGDVRFGFGVQNRGGEETEIAGRARNVEIARERERFAGVDRFGARQLLEIALDQVRDAQENARPIRRRRARPTGNAFSAAATASSTSRASLSGTCEYGLPVAGSMLSRYFPPTGSTN